MMMVRVGTQSFVHFLPGLHTVHGYRLEASERFRIVANLTPAF